MCWSLRCMKYARALLYKKLQWRHFFLSRLRSKLSYCLLVILYTTRIVHYMPLELLRPNCTSSLYRMQLGNVWLYIYLDSRSQWPRCLRHELPSLALTLGSWVRIPLKAWMFCVCMCSFCVCVILCLGRSLATGWSLVQGALPSVKNDYGTE
jgi:hypothetical protein